MERHWLLWKVTCKENLCTPRIFNNFVKIHLSIFNAKYLKYTVALAFFKKIFEVFMAFIGYFTLILVF
jgi:hypothetical protein